MAWPSALAFDFRSDRAIHGSLDFSCARTYFRLEKWSSSEGRHSSSGHTLGEISLFFFFLHIWDFQAHKMVPAINRSPDQHEAIQVSILHNALSPRTLIVVLPGPGALHREV